MGKISTKGKGLSKLPPQNKYFILALLGIFLLCVFFLSNHKIEEDDFFWHLATGKYIVENKTVPSTDVFSYPSQNSEWIPFEWGWDLINYTLNSIGGYNAVSIFSSLIFCFLFFLYFHLLKRFNVNPVITLLLLLLLLFAVFDRLSPRPHIFTYLFFIIVLYLLLTFKYINRERYFKRLYVLPVIFLIWGNIHLGVIAGAFLLFVFILSEIIIFYFPNRFTNKEIAPLTSVQLKKLLLIFVVCVAVLVINPHGIETYSYAYSHTKMKMLESIQEWQNPFSGMIESTFVITLYKVFFFSGLMILLYSFKKRDLTFFLFYIAFAIYSIRAIRFTVDYEIVMVFFLAVSLDYYLKSYFKASSGILKFLNGNVPKIFLILFMVFIVLQTISNNIYIMLKFNRNTGFGVYENVIPVGLTKFMKENAVKGKVFNNYESGGYLIWNLGEKNFIDSRNLSDELFNEYYSILNMAPGFEAKLEKYGVDYITYFEPKLVKYPNMLKSQITEYLFKNEKWKLVYWDDRSILFLKDTPANAQLIAKYEYKIFNPYKAVFYQKEFESIVRNSPDETKKEMQRKRETEPDGYFYQGMNQIVSKVNK